MSAEYKQNHTANPMWGGHYERGPAEIMEEINASIGFDHVLYMQDIRGSLAHAAMLEARGILTTEEARQISVGLQEIQQEFEEGTIAFKPALEDIHMHVEARLKEKIGDVAGKLHTARSRNDQVATDFKLWVRDAIDTVDAVLKELQAALLDQAEAHADTLMPGFTHLQTAQPVTFGHHLLAYVEMFGRDRGRFTDARVRLNECPLGAAALAGTSFPIDRQLTAKTLGFDRPTANSLDSVSDRDFALEFLSGAALCAGHLSRFAEEMVLWCSHGFRFITLSEAFTTGSSIMPQKRNPDAAELTRAKTGRINGALISLLTVMKGLPLAYSKDMQEDKEPVFDAANALMLGIQATIGMVRDMQVNEEAMREAAEQGYPTATDLADWLVRALGMPFRNAHHVTGSIVRYAEEQGLSLQDVPLEVMQTIEPGIHAGVLEILSVEASAASRTSYGGTAPENVQHSIIKARQRYLEGSDD